MQSRPKIKELRSISKFEEYTDMGQRYVLRENDTLPLIAFKFYHDHQLWPLIWLHNIKVQHKYLARNILISPNFLFAGMEIYLPPKKDIKDWYLSSDKFEYNRLLQGFLSTGTNFGDVINITLNDKKIKLEPKTTIDLGGKIIHGAVIKTPYSEVVQSCELLYGKLELEGSKNIPLDISKASGKKDLDYVLTKNVTDATTGFVSETQLSFNGSTLSPQAAVDFKSFKISVENGQGPKISKTIEHTINGLKFKLDLAVQLIDAMTCKFEGTAAIDLVIGECEFTKGEKRKASLKDFSFKYTAIVKNNIDQNLSPKPSLATNLTKTVQLYKKFVASNGSPLYPVTLEKPAHIKDDAEIPFTAVIDEEFNKTFHMLYQRYIMLKPNKTLELGYQCLTMESFKERYFEKTILNAQGIPFSHWYLSAVGQLSTQAKINEPYVVLDEENNGFKMNWNYVLQGVIIIGVVVAAAACATNPACVLVVSGAGLSTSR